jgi:hypothetical protein
MESSVLVLRVTLGFRRVVNAICVLFRDFTQRIVVIPCRCFGEGLPFSSFKGTARRLGCLTFEDGTNRL